MASLILRGGRATPSRFHEPRPALPARKGATPPPKKGSSFPGDRCLHSRHPAFGQLASISALCRARAQQAAPPPSCCPKAAPSAQRGELGGWTSDRGRGACTPMVRRNQPLEAAGMTAVSHRETEAQAESDPAGSQVSYQNAPSLTSGLSSSQAAINVFEYRLLGLGGFPQGENCGPPPPGKHVHTNTQRFERNFQRSSDSSSESVSVARSGSPWEAPAPTSTYPHLQMIASPWVLRCRPR